MDTQLRRLLVFTLFTLAGLPQAHSQQALVPAHQIPDEIAYVHLFNVLQSAPPPHWDRLTREGWLTARGFTQAETDPILAAATRFSRQRKALEEELMRVFREYGVHSAQANDKQESIKRQRQVELDSTLFHLGEAAGELTRQKLARLADAIKRDIKLSAPPAAAKDHR